MQVNGKRILTGLTVSALASGRVHARARRIVTSRRFTRWSRKFTVSVSVIVGCSMIPMAEIASVPPDFPGGFDSVDSVFDAVVSANGA